MQEGGRTEADDVVVGEQREHVSKALRSEAVEAYDTSSSPSPLNYSVVFL